MHSKQTYRISFGTASTTAGILFLVAAALLVTDRIQADEAKLLSAKPIWKTSGGVTSTDLTEFNDRWYCVFTELSPKSAARQLHVISSEDGNHWQTTAQIPCVTASRGRPKPRFSVTPDDRLMLVATGSEEYVSATNADGTVSKGIGVQSRVWTSENGKQWQAPKVFAERHYNVTSLASHKGGVYSLSHGCICGSAQTIRIGNDVMRPYVHTFSGFFPGDGSLIFSREFAFCLMSRSGKTGIIGKSNSHYDEWQWDDVGIRISHPGLQRLRDGRIVAVVGLFGGDERTSLCWFDDSTGKLTEALKLPVKGRVPTGQALGQEQQLWISYQGDTDEGRAIFLAKTDLPSRPIRSASR